MKLATLAALIGVTSAQIEPCANSSECQTDDSPSLYLGCYNDDESRDFKEQLDNVQKTSECKDLALAGGFKYFAT